MLDINAIRAQPGLVQQAAADKHMPVDVDSLLTLDDGRKKIIAEAESLKALKNKASKEIAEAKKKGQDPAAILSEMKTVADKIKALDDRQAIAESQLRERMLEVPNVPLPEVPAGKSPADNVVVRESGDTRVRGFTPKNHVELAEALDVLDFKRGAKVAGSGFVLYKGWGAKLERALINYFLDSNSSRGYTEVFPPFMVNPRSAMGTGQLPKSKDQMYYVAQDDLYLVPTAEVPVTNIFQDEILGEKDLPICLTAYSACFRREAGSWGKDTRGFLRVHEFNKVELVKFTHPDRSAEEHEKLTADAEALLKGLGLKYRVLALCRGDLSFAAARCYDLEVYAEGEKRWLEVSSCSNFLDFQARRANIRFRDAAGKVRFLHTLNGSGLATARILVAILENYQAPDGSVLVPEVLRPYLGGLEKIQKRP